MRLTLSLLLLPLAVFFGDVSGGLHSRKTREPFTIIPKSRHNVLEHWIEQRLDHFNPTDNRTWEMRYMSNDELFKPGGAVVIHIGGEWEISAGSLLGGQTYDIARQHNGYLFYTEHRYYGKSYPTPDASTKNLQYLNVDQALADLAYFIEHVKKTIPGLETSKVVVIGGSYAGSMATWFRLKYPHLVDAALASSAPLFAVADFYKYHEVVGRSLKSNGGPRCYEIVEKGTQQLRQEIKTAGGPKAVAKLFNLCNPVESTNALDFGTFLSTIGEVFAGIIQYHKAGDIERACDLLKEESRNNTELYALATFVKGIWGANCSDVDYQSMVKAFRNTNWGSESTVGSMRQWFYQTCTEYGYYQTDTSKDQPFGNGANTLDLYINLCKDLYEEDFAKHARQILDNGIERTNIVYGALSPAVTRVISTHGTIDPWHSIGVLEDINDQSPTIVVPGTSHCEDLQSISSQDSKEMKAAKQRVLDLMKEWLK